MSVAALTMDDEHREDTRLCLGLSLGGVMAVPIREDCEKYFNKLAYVQELGWCLAHGRQVVAVTVL